MSEEKGSGEELIVHSGVLVGGVLAHFFLNALNTAYSTVLVLIKEEFALSYTLSGALMSSYFVGYTIGQIPWGLLADRVGSRRTMTLSIIGIATFTVFFGLAADIWQAVASRFLAGLLGAGVFVPGVKLISGWFSPRRRGTALGILSVGGSIGLVTTSWTAPLLAIGHGWRWSTIAYGALGLASSAAIWRMLKDRGRVETSAETRVDLAGAIRARSFWILALTQFIRLGSNFAFISWLPLLLQEEYGLGLVSAGIAFSLFNLAGMFANPAGGFMSDRIGEKAVILVSFSAVALSVLLFTVVRMSPLVFVVAFVLGWFINFVRSPSFTILPKLYGVEAAGKISGIHNTFASLGALALPLLLGYIRDVTDSYQAGWMILSALLFSGTVVNLFLKRCPNP